MLGFGQLPGEQRQRLVSLLGRGTAALILDGALQLSDTPAQLLFLLALSRALHRRLPPVEKIQMAAGPELLGEDEGVLDPAHLEQQPHQVHVHLILVVDVAGPETLLMQLAAHPFDDDHRPCGRPPLPPPGGPGTPGPVPRRRPGAS